MVTVFSPCYLEMSVDNAINLAHVTDLPHDILNGFATPPYMKLSTYLLIVWRCVVLMVAKAWVDLS